MKTWGAGRRRRGPALGSRLRSVVTLASSESLAKKSCTKFATRKALLLASYAAEHTAAKTALVVLERMYSKLTQEFLAVSGTTYATWLAHGPYEELEEVTAAIADPATWDRLVETYAERRRAASGGRS